jgi:hypothetical protein
VHVGDARVDGRRRVQVQQLVQQTAMLILLNHADCSLNHANCSLNHANWSLNQARWWCASGWSPPCPSTATGATNSSTVTTARGDSNNSITLIVVRGHSNNVIIIITYW